MMLSILALLFVSGIFVSAQSDSDTPTVPIAANYTGMYRPQIHFSPPQGFMNDPNGMFQDANGTYHLYYQLNPTDTIAGNQHWGHATSNDLYHWTNQAIALSPYDNVTGIFSGSAVIDSNNTSGFFPNQTNGVVAIYTANSPTSQDQAIAYSYDDGYTWELYADNPVITLNSTQFRDPKVIWHTPTSTWVMVVAYAVDLTIGFYTSPDLISWTFTSNFTYHGIPGLQYECPNLVELPFRPSASSSDTSNSISADPVWTLYLSINPGAPLGGSIGQYFPGTFNGTHFTAYDAAARLADFGKDNYASQWFYREGDDGSAEGLSIAWASNWQYTNYVPTGPAEGWQSAMSLPRRNWMTNSSGSRQPWTLVSYPVALEGVMGRELGKSAAGGGGLGDGESVLGMSAEGVFLVGVNVTGLNTTGLENTASLNVTVRGNGTGEALRAGQFFGGDPSFWMDRGGVKGFENPYFADKVSTGLVLGTEWELLMVVDRSIWEVFLLGGERSATLTYFAEGLLDEVEVRVQGLNDDAEVSVAIWELDSAWAEMEDGMGVVQGNVTGSNAQVVKRTEAGGGGVW